MLHVWKVSVRGSARQELIDPHSSGMREPVF